MREKKIRKDIISVYLLKGILTACLPCLYIIVEPALILHKPEETGGAILIAAAVMGIFAIAALIAGMRHAGKISKEIRALEQNGHLLDDEDLVSLTDEFSYGDHWLIYMDDTDCRFWLRDQIRYIQAEKSDQPDAVKGILRIITDGKEDAMVYTKQDDVPAVLKKWIWTDGQSEDSRELTI